MKDLILHFFTLPLSKRVRIVYYFLQVIFTTILSYQLYRYFVATAKDPTLSDNYSVVIDFIFSGRILLYLLFFAAIWVIFYSIGRSIILGINKKLTEWVLNTIWKKIQKSAKRSNADEEDSISSAMKRFFIRLNAFQYKSEADQALVPGPRFDSYFSGAKLLGELGNQNEKFTGPYLTLTFIIQFCFLYFNGLSASVNSVLVDSFIVLLLLFYWLLFFLTIFVLESLSRLGKKTVAIFETVGVGLPSAE